ncbi:hypothetical protein [Georgenia ruanii]|uniref:hypothetical protein n=1 Tax=Georgenia ruanii TaxID=348442 RepID=UPI00126531C1|nr:hypothetical protein [Georgenia ruanii]
MKRKILGGLASVVIGVAVLGGTAGAASASEHGDGYGHHYRYDDGRHHHRDFRHHDRDFRHHHGHHFRHYHNWWGWD